MINPPAHILHYELHKRKWRLVDTTEHTATYEKASFSKELILQIVLYRYTAFDLYLIAGGNFFPLYNCKNIGQLKLLENSILGDMGELSPEEMASHYLEREQLCGLK